MSYSYLIGQSVWYSEPGSSEKVVAEVVSVATYTNVDGDVLDLLELSNGEIRFANSVYSSNGVTQEDLGNAVSLVGKTVLYRESTSSDYEKSTVLGASAFKNPSTGDLYIQVTLADGTKISANKVYYIVSWSGAWPYL